jgi:hypothetical protein
VNGTMRVEDGHNRIRSDIDFSARAGLIVEMTRD